MRSYERSVEFTSTDEFAPRNETELVIESVCNGIKRMLIEKNRAYGDSALNPVRIFSRTDGEEQLRVRIDDKLSRLMRGQPDAFGEDVYQDLVGYIILLICKRRYSG